MSHDAPLDLAEITITELRHRIKNLITVVQALVSQTLRTTASADDAAVAIEERLSAMARSVDLLLRSDWGSIQLEELIRLALSHLVAYNERVELAGPPVRVNADWALMLVLALHELETNAIKYGALSGTQGNITVHWAVLDDEAPDQQLKIQWTERGGPEVRCNGHLGFGSRLATTLLQRQLKGSAKLDFRPGGLTWCLIAPLA